MNTASIAPEVAQFAEAVRARLADLTSDEREELAGGLEADLGDLVEERGVEALGDPVVYAEELRTAAGLSPAMGQVRIKKAAGETVDGWLDAAHDRWDRAVTGLPGSPWEFVVSLQPAWWVLRAYIAVQSMQIWHGGGYALSWLPPFGFFGWVVLALVLVVSVQIGRRRIWPGKPGVGGRLVLLGLNLLAVVMSVGVLDSVPNVSQRYVDDAAFSDSGYTVDGDGTGITSNGSDVSNIYPYDADG
ncbi:MAG: hypothetical protein H0X12_05655 [Nocardioides sp.]|nr:hypothetical protein [Nocardioides sp.]